MIDWLKGRVRLLVCAQGLPWGVGLKPGLRENEAAVPGKGFFNTAVSGSWKSITGRLLHSLSHVFHPLIYDATATDWAPIFES